MGRRQLQHRNNRIKYQDISSQGGCLGKGASFFCSDFFLYTRVLRVIIYLEKEMLIHVS